MNNHQVTALALTSWRRRYAPALPPQGITTLDLSKSNDSVPWCDSVCGDAESNKSICAHTVFTADNPRQSCSTKRVILPMTFPITRFLRLHKVFAICAMVAQVFRCMQEPSSGHIVWHQEYASSRSCSSYGSIPAICARCAAAVGYMSVQESFVPDEVSRRSTVVTLNR